MNLCFRLLLIPPKRTVLRTKVEQTSGRAREMDHNIFGDDALLFCLALLFLGLPTKSLFPHFQKPAAY